MNPRNFADVSKDPFPVLPPPPATALALAPTGGSLATPAGSIPVTNVFNQNALPSDVRLRLEQDMDLSQMMTRSTMEIEFDSSIPNTTLDPTCNTMRTTLSYLDPPVTGDRLITRNGAIYSL